MATKVAGQIVLSDVKISTIAYQRLLNGKMGKTEASQFLSDMATSKDTFTMAVIVVIKEWLRLDKVYRDRGAKTGIKFPVDTIVTGLIYSTKANQSS